MTAGGNRGTGTVRAEGEDALAGVTLLFVYNADSGAVSALRDYLHKAVSPSTYQCNLCALTYGALGMRGDWAEFVEALGVAVEFLHRDELQESHGIDDVDLPVVLVSVHGRVEEMIPAVELNGLGTLEQLEALVSKRVDELRRRGSPV